MSDIGPITIGAGGHGAAEVQQHVWFPATEVGIMTTPQRLVRVWDRDWTYMLPLPPGSGALTGETYTATLPADHELAVQLRADAQTFLTVDEGGLRWVGRLHEWQVLKTARTGGCAECEHCQVRVMQIAWVKDSTPFSFAEAFA
ncbi:hypothetical protein [Nocardia sp. MW-W600-9]